MSEAEFFLTHTHLENMTWRSALVLESGSLFFQAQWRLPQPQIFPCVVEELKENVILNKRIFFLGERTRSWELVRSPEIAVIAPVTKTLRLL